MAAGGAPSKYKPAYCAAIIKHGQKGHSLTSFAGTIGVCRETIREWARVHPEFSVACKAAKAAACHWWEETSMTVARQGGGNAAICVLGMKNMGADDWRDKVETEHSGTVTTITQIELTGPS